MENAQQVQSNLIMQYGVSEQLRAEFDMLRDVPSKHGAHKFSERTVGKIAQHLVCRNYANLCYEFAHLNWAIVNIDASVLEPEQALIEFYWLQEVNTKNSFVEYFEQALATRATQNLGMGADDTLVIFNGAKMSLFDAQLKMSINRHEFLLNANRANLFSCFMEWLIACVPNLLSDISTFLLDKGSNSISDFATHLQKTIYQYLGEHLPALKLQQRYRLLASWYERRPTQCSEDKSLLEFWQCHNQHEGFGKYSNTLKETLSYFKAIEISETSMQVQFAKSIDQNADSSGDSLSWSESNLHFERLQVNEDNGLNVFLFTQEIKVLSKIQYELIALLCDNDNEAIRLPLSYIRNTLFGKIQHQVIQAKRNQAIAHSSEIDALIIQDYQAIKKALVSLQASNLQALYAFCHILIDRQEMNEAMFLLLKLTKHIPSQSEYYQSLVNLVKDIDNAESLGEKELGLLSASNPWFANMLMQMKKAFQQINRKGFTTKTLVDTEQYLECAKDLFSLNKRLKTLIKQADKSNAFESKNFEADRFIFLDEFTKLYISE